MKHVPGKCGARGFRTNLDGGPRLDWNMPYRKHPLWSALF